MAEIYVDANAVIDYARERSLRELGIKSTSNTGSMLRRHLGGHVGEGRVAIPMAAYKEARKNLRKDVVRRVDKTNAEEVYARASLLVNKRLRATVCRDSLALVGEVREMYRAIRSDPKSRKLAEWRSRKGRHAVRPSLGSGNDLTILSTAAQHAGRRRTELWTRDIDFTMFVDEIAIGPQVIKILWPVGQF